MRSNVGDNPISYAESFVEDHKDELDGHYCFLGDIFGKSPYFDLLGKIGRKNPEATQAEYQLLWNALQVGEQMFESNESDQKTFQSFIGELCAQIDVMIAFGDSREDRLDYDRLLHPFSCVDSNKLAVLLMIAAIAGGILIGLSCVNPFHWEMHARVAIGVVSTIIALSSARWSCSRFSLTREKSDACKQIIDETQSLIRLPDYVSSASRLRHGSPLG